MLDIVFEDKYIIVVNKPSKLLTISNEKEKEKTLYHLVSLYLKKKNKNNKVFIVHRLDFDTSGLVLFAKTEAVKEKLQTNWNEVQRKYMAVLSGKLIKREGVIQSYLKETKTLMTYSCKDSSGKLAITEYKVIKYQNNFTLVEINIKTGRKNQIRVHMKDLGYPIVGDLKYGNVKNKYMLLHAYFLKFVHPITNEIICLENKLPNYFKIIA